MKEELNIPKEVKQDLELALYKQAPDGLLASVMQKIKRQKAQVSAVPDLQYPFFIAMCIIGLGIFLLVNGSEEKSNTSISFDWIAYLGNSVLWWSVIAVALVVFADLLLNQKRRAKQNS
jgi:uncharacterized membrane protein YidH (DUF202 family)